MSQITRLCGLSVLPVRPAFSLDSVLAMADCNLGVALEQTGKIQDAIRHYEQALRIKPDYAEVQNELTRLRAVQ